MKTEFEKNKGLFSGVFAGYLVLLLHILLILALGVAVILIKGIYDFRWVIFTAGLVLICVSGYIFYKRMKEGKRSLLDAMNNPALRDRTLEISFLGGMASVKLGHSDEQPKLIDAESSEPPKQLAAPRTHVQELGELAKMLDAGLITREEFDRLKKELVA